MEAKFKIGQYVWDAVNFPGMVGNVATVGTEYLVVNWWMESIGDWYEKVYSRDGRVEFWSRPTLMPFNYEFDPKPLTKVEEEI